MADLRLSKLKIDLSTIELPTVPKGKWSDHVVTNYNFKSYLPGSSSAPPSPVRNSALQNLQRLSIMVHRPLVIDTSDLTYEPPQRDENGVEIGTRRRSVSDVVAQVSRLPVPAPGSPACKALRKGKHPS